MNPPRPRLAVVLSHPTQYYSPWFRWIAEHAPVELKVFYLWDGGVTARHDPQFGAAFAWDIDLLSGYAHEFVPNTSPAPGTDHFNGLQNPGLPARLSTWKPAAVLLFGYKYPSHLRAVLWARLHRVPLLFRGDSHFMGRTAPGPAKTLPLRLLYRQFSAFLVVGAANRDYFNRLGVPAKKLFFAPHAVDAARFDPALPEIRSAASALRRQLGLADGVRVVLYAGKLVPAKQPRELLAAWLALAPRNAALVYVGSGEELPALQAEAAAAPAGSVHFLPFANQSEMPARYALADLFVLPSRGVYETWGLAVNEAMHLGLPCLVSDRVGCQRDLVTDGETGWVFPADDTRALREKLALALTALANPERNARLHRAVAERIAGYTFAQTTGGLLTALGSLSLRNPP